MLRLTIRHKITYRLDENAQVDMTTGFYHSEIAMGDEKLAVVSWSTTGTPDAETLAGEENYLRVLARERLEELAASLRETEAEG